MDKTNPEKTRSPQSVVELLSMVRQGQAIIESGRAITEVMEEVRYTGKKGSVVITIQLEPEQVNSWHELVQVKVQAKVEAKPPKRSGASQVLYVTDDNHLSLRDPKQPPLPGIVPDEVDEPAAPHASPAAFKSAINQ